MLPRLLNPTSAKLRRWFAEGLELTSHDVEARCFVSLRRARDYLSALHGAAEIHIRRWRRDAAVGKYQPVYAWGEGKDAPRPKAAPPKIRTRRLRHDNPEAVIREVIRKRAARARAKFEAQGVPA